MEISNDTIIDSSEYLKTHPNILQHLNQTGGCVILIGCPRENFSVGIDYRSFRVGPKFLGFKLVPVGAHFLYWNFGNDDYAFTLGKFVFIKQKQVIVWKWNEGTESFDCADENEEEAYALGVSNHEFEGNLGLYPVEWASKWENMSMFIDRSVIDAIQPISQRIGSRMKEYDDGPLQNKNSTENKNSKEKKNISIEEENVCVDDMGVESFTAACSGDTDILFFSDIPRGAIPLNATPDEITRISMDTSPIVEDMILKRKNKDTFILGELQFCFVCFILGQNYSAFEQWKAMLLVLCDCSELVQKRPDLFSNLIRVLHGQLQQAPDDFFADDLLRSNFLTTCISNLCETCTLSTAPPKVQSRIQHLKDLVRVKFKIHIEDLMTLNEDGPVIVDLNEPLARFDETEDMSDPTAANS